MTTIAEYVSKVGVHVDMGQLRKVDRYLASIRQKMQKYSKANANISIDSFSVNQVKLNTALGNALDIASRKTTFEIAKFSINSKALKKTLKGIAPIVVNGSSVSGSASRKPSAEQMRRSGVRNSEWDNQQALRSEIARKRFDLQNERLRLQRERLNEQHQRAMSRGERLSRSAAAGAASGGFVGRGLSSFYGPAIALAGGGYGLSQLNQRNQQVVAAQLQTQAVIQQANPNATPQQGAESFAWLRSQGNRIGFNYLEAAPDYNKLLSGLTGAGMSVRQGQDVFQGFSELSRVNKLDRVQQQRVFRALSQVAGKGKLQSEELVGQLARIWPLAA